MGVWRLGKKGFMLVSVKTQSGRHLGREPTAVEVLCHLLQRTVCVGVCFIVYCLFIYCAIVVEFVAELVRFFPIVTLACY